MNTETLILVLIIEGIALVPLLAVFAFYGGMYFARSSQLVSDARKRSESGMAGTAASKPAPEPPLKDRILGVIRTNAKAMTTQQIIDAVKDRKVGLVLRDHKDLFVQTGKDSWGLLEWAKGPQTGAQPVTSIPAGVAEMRPETASRQQQDQDEPLSGTLKESITALFDAQKKPLWVKDIAEKLHLSPQDVEQTMKKSPDVFVRINKEWGLKAWAKTE